MHLIQSEKKYYLMAHEPENWGCKTEIQDT